MLGQRDDRVGVALVASGRQSAAVATGTASTVAGLVNRDDRPASGVILREIAFPLDLVDHVALVIELLDDRADIQILEDRVGGGHCLGGHELLLLY